MVEINLLPWREEKQRYELQMMRRMLVISIFSVLVVWLAGHLAVSWKLHRAKQREQQLLASMPITINAKTAGEERDLQDVSGEILLEILTAAADAAKSGVCYQRIVRDAGGIEFAGDALSMQSLTSGLRRLQASSILSDIKLANIKQDLSRENYNFTARASLRAKRYGG